MNELNGVDLDALTPSLDAAFPAVIAGRVLQLDADSVLYHATYEEKPFAVCIEKFFDITEYRRKMAGCELVTIHLTGSSKGGRYDIATVQEYQANRNGKDVPSNLHALKQHVISMTEGLNERHEIRLHEDQEADDGMTQGNYQAMLNGTPELSVIMSMDKDLWMSGGLHCNWYDFEMVMVNGFGSIWLDRSKSSPKIRGFGTSFFWAQLLEGDTADHIKGLPKLGPPMLNRIAPTIKMTKLQDIVDTVSLQTSAGQQRVKKAMNALADRPHKACGTVLAYDIMKDVKSDQEAMLLVIEAYQSHYGTEPFTHNTWDGRDITRTFAEMIMENAQLLWMRRVENESPSAFFKDVNEGRGWDGKPVQKLS